MSPQANTKQAAPESETPEKRKARVEGIKKLIQQTSSGVRAEAESAAFRACVLIRRHGLDIVDPSLVNDLHTQIHTLTMQVERLQQGVQADEEDDDFPFGGIPPRRATSGGFSGMSSASTRPVGGSSSNLFSGWATPRTPNVGAPRRPATPSPQPAAPPPPPKATAPPTPAAMAAPILMPSSHFAGKCKTCGSVISKGSPVRWQKGVGVWCPTTSCYSDWLAMQQAASSFNPNIP